MVSAIRRSKRTAMTSEPMVRDYRLALESARGRPRAAARRRGDRYFAGQPPGRRGGAFLACQESKLARPCASGVALERGAAAVLWEPAPSSAVASTGGGRRYPRSGLRARAGELADRFFRSPSADLKVAGITGTNGKTTTAYCSPRPPTPSGGVARISARWAPAARAVLPAPISTMTPYRHRRLAEARDDGAAMLAMEFRPALDQGRVGGGVRFDTAVFTN